MPREVRLFCNLYRHDPFFFRLQTTVPCSHMISEYIEVVKRAGFFLAECFYPIYGTIQMMFSHILPPIRRRLRANFCSRRGVTLPEILVTTLLLGVIISGLYLFFGRQTRKITETDSKRRMVQRVESLRGAILQRLRVIGRNPLQTSYEIDQANPAFSDCNTFPFYDPSESETQICHGVQHASYFKLAYAGDVEGNTDGVVDESEAFALVLRKTGGSCPADCFDATTQNSPTMPDYLTNNRVDVANMSPSAIVPYTPPGPPTIPNLPSVPRLCELNAGEVFTETYDLLARTYSAGVPVYSVLADSVLCFGVAFFRKHNDYEACYDCWFDDDGDGINTKIAVPQACLLRSRGTELPYDFFRGQTPLLNQNEADEGLVFMPFPSMSESLHPLQMYSVRMIKMTVILEDDKITPGEINPLTNRARLTERMDLTFRIPDANLPCDFRTGNCTFNNSQCVK